MPEALPLVSGFHMWATLGIIALALVFYVVEWTPIEVTSIGVICALLLFFSIFPFPAPGHPDQLEPSGFLHGFANPALITVLALLVMGQGLVRTGAFDLGVRVLIEHMGRLGGLSLVVVLAVVAILSAFVNNTPIVVIFIPIMQMVAARLRISPSKTMMPLSFVAVLGGMTTLIGSSTNLLVNGALLEVGQRPLGFFEFSVPALVLAVVGLVYAVVLAPRLLPDRGSLVDKLFIGDGKQFVAQVTVQEGSSFVGKDAPGGMFEGFRDMTVHLVQRGEEAHLPPFEGLVLRPGDILIVAAPRKALTEFLSKHPGLLYSAPGGGGSSENGDGMPWRGKESMVAEAMVTPASRMIGRTLLQIGFHHQTHCVVLGIQRRSRMIRGRMTDIRLQAGDVLLIQGPSQDIDALGGHGDVLLIQWSQEELPVVDHAKRAVLIFLAVVALAASGVLPTVAAALTGALAMVVSGVLNVRQAARAIDARIVTAIAGALAMGLALEKSGGAAFLAGQAVAALQGFGPATILSAFFLLVAVFTNILSNNACAVLFTPIGVDIALMLGIPPHVFAIVVVLAANCSFASPLGYQTNLLVMGPGHYRFRDFVRAGIPLIVLLWVTFTLFGPWYFGV